MTRKVSFYIPCFNSAKTIGPCLEAVFKQEYPVVEVIVVNDGSTDESSSIISRYPVRLLNHATNQGLAAARNTAVKNVKGDFIASVDADCVPRPDWLKFLMLRLDSRETAAAGGRLLENNIKSVFDEWRAAHMKQDWDGRGGPPAFLFGANTVFRKEALTNIGYYKECYRNNYEDVDISRRLITAGYVLAYEPQAEVYHLKNDCIESLFDTYWKWNIDFYEKEGFYSNPETFINKSKDTLGLVNRYMEEDIVSGRTRLLYLDLLLYFYQSLKDLRHFSFPEHCRGISFCNDILSVRIALFDLVFFYHWDRQKPDFATLVSANNAFLQNVFALKLILGAVMRHKLSGNNFLAILYRHLLLLLCNSEDHVLADKMVGLAEARSDWSGLYKKNHSNLNSLFLSNASLSFYHWLEEMSGQNSKIVQMLELSADQTYEAYVSMRKGGLR